VGLLVVLVGSFGCLPATIPDVDLKLEPGTICMTVDGLQAEKDKSFAEGKKAGQLAGCKADVVLMNPTYAQLRKFLAANQTLTMCEGNCVDRTKNLSEAAVRNGWEMYVVLMNAEETGTGHVIGAFQTKDKGMIFVESQTLWEVKVDIGYDYSINFTKNNWSFPQFTIKQIGLFQ